MIRTDFEPIVCFQTVKAGRFVERYFGEMGGVAMLRGRWYEVMRKRSGDEGMPRRWGRGSEAAF